MPSSPKQSLTRRERERERHRSEILGAAEEIFSLKGFAGTTIEDIAKRADYSVGSIYNFFSGKEDLIRQVLLRLVKSRIADIEERVRPLEHDPEAALRALTDFWVAHHTRHGAFLKMAFVFKLAGHTDPCGPPQDEELRGYMEDYEQSACCFFAAGSQAGIFHPLPPKHLLLMFEGICRAFNFAWERNAETRPKTELADELYTTVHTALTGKCHEPTAE